MPTSDMRTNCDSLKSTTPLAPLALVILFLMPLTGCADERMGESGISSLSAPTNATGGWDSNQASQSTAGDADGEKDPVITLTSTPSGITANVSWDPPPDLIVAGYTIHYGIRSQDVRSEEAVSEESDPEESELSWCSQGEGQTVGASSTTITGLQPNTPYFFAIRAVTENELESLCSNAIVVVTPPVVES